MMMYLYLYFRSVWELQTNTALFELSKNLHITAIIIVTCTVYDLWLQMKNRQNSSNEIAHIYVHFSIIRGTLIAPSIISRSVLTDDLLSAAHYKRLHTFCGLSELFKMFNIVIVV